MKRAFVMMIIVFMLIFALAAFVTVTTSAAWDGHIEFDYSYFSETFQSEFQIGRRLHDSPMKIGMATNFKHYLEFQQIRLFMDYEIPTDPGMTFTLSAIWDDLIFEPIDWNFKLRYEF